MRRFAWSLLLLGASATACKLGPPSLRASRGAYNRAIRRTADEQMLLNLVRLRYRETPVFLEVGSISAQFVFGQKANLGGRIVEDVGPSAPTPNWLDVGGILAYEERPTITYTLLQGDAFVQRLMSPLELNTIMLLYYSGWRIDRILRLTVQSINGVENATRAAGPTPDEPPQYQEFAAVARHLWELQKRGLLDIGYELRTVEKSGAISTERVSAGDLVAAAQGGFALKRTDDGKAYILTASERVPVMRFSPEAIESTHVREIVRILRLVPGRSEYRLTKAFSAEPTGPDGRFDTLAIGTRSLIGTLFYLSQAVEVPEGHEEKGLVTLTRTADGRRFDWSNVTGDLLRIRCSRMTPRRAAVAVRYRGYWFYIDEADVSSKSTFFLLSQLFTLQAGGAEAAAPVLTLPIGG